MTAKDYRNSEWYDVMVHADHNDIIYRRRYRNSTNAYNCLQLVADAYRADGWDVSRAWGHSHVHSMEKRGAPLLVLRIVASGEWERDWEPFMRVRDRVLRPELASNVNRQHRGRGKRVLRRWADEAKKFEGVQV